MRSQRMDGGTFSLVQHPILDTSGVGGDAHLPAQCVQLPDQVTLAGAANGGIAGHVAYCVQIDGKQDGVKAQTGSSQRRFNAGVSGTDHRNITLSCKIRHKILP